jgi:hypothetical protein
VVIVHRYVDLLYDVNTVIIENYNKPLKIEGIFEKVIIRNNTETVNLELCIINELIVESSKYPCHLPTIQKLIYDGKITPEPFDELVLRYFPNELLMNKMEDEDHTMYDRIKLKQIYDKNKTIMQIRSKTKYNNVKDKISVHSSYLKMYIDELITTGDIDTLRTLDNKYVDERILFFQKYQNKTAEEYYVMNEKVSRLFIMKLLENPDQLKMMNQIFNNIENKSLLEELKKNLTDENELIMVNKLLFFMKIREIELENFDDSLVRSGKIPKRGFPIFVNYDNKIIRNLDYYLFNVILINEDKKLFCKQMNIEQINKQMNEIRQEFIVMITEKLTLFEQNFIEAFDVYNENDLYYLRFSILNKTIHDENIDDTNFESIMDKFFIRSSNKSDRIKSSELASAIEKYYESEKLEKPKMNFEHLISKKLNDSYEKKRMQDGNWWLGIKYKNE